jgi:hypothetical protein
MASDCCLRDLIEHGRHWVHLHPVALALLANDRNGRSAPLQGSAGRIRPPTVRRRPARRWRRRSRGARRSTTKSGKFRAGASDGTPSNRPCPAQTDDTWRVPTPNSTQPFRARATSSPGSAGRRTNWTDLGTHDVSFNHVLVRAGDRIPRRACSRSARLRVEHAKNHTRGVFAHHREHADTQAVCSMCTSASFSDERCALSFRTRPSHPASISDRLAGLGLIPEPGSPRFERFRANRVFAHHKPSSPISTMPSLRADRGASRKRG